VKLRAPPSAMQSNNPVLLPASNKIEPSGNRRIGAPHVHNHQAPKALIEPVAIHTLSFVPLPHVSRASLRNSDICPRQPRPKQEASLSGIWNDRLQEAGR